MCSFKARVLVTLSPLSLSVSPLSVCVFPAQLGSNSKTSARAATLRGQQAGWGWLCHPALPGDDQMSHEALQKTLGTAEKWRGANPGVGSPWKTAERGDAVPKQPAPGAGELSVPPSDVLPARHITAEPHATCTALLSGTS